MRAEKKFMIPRERAEAQKAEAAGKEQELKKNIEKMTPEQINDRIREIEDRFREIDSLAGSLPAAEKAFGPNAFEKMKKEYERLERERALLFVERPVAVCGEQIEEIQELETTELKKEPEKLEKPQYIALHEHRKTTAMDYLTEETKKAPKQFLKDLKGIWTDLRHRLKKDEKGIWWPIPEKMLEQIRVEELDKEPKEEPVAPPLPRTVSSVSIMPIIGLAKKIEAQQQPEKEAAEPPKKESPESYKERDEKIRKTLQYKEFAKAVANLGKPYQDLKIKPRGSDLLFRFLDGIYRVGKPGSAVHQAGELIYQDMLSGELKMPPQKWEYENRVKLMSQQFDYMLLSDLSKEQKRIENEIKAVEKHLEELEPKIVFLTSTERWAHIAAVHNREVELKMYQEYLKMINLEIQLEKKGVREIKEMPDPSEIFQVPKAWLDFPEVTIDYDELWGDFPEVEIEKKEKSKTKKAA